MHLTNKHCKEMDSSKFELEEIPGVNDWMNLSKLVSLILEKLIPSKSVVSSLDKSIFIKTIENIGKMDDK